MRVANMTACFSLSDRINLHRLVKNCLFASWTRGQKLNQRSFFSVKLQVYTIDRKITGLVYSSGRVVLIGAQNMDQLRECVNQIMLLTGRCVKDHLVVSNIVFATFFRPDINIQSLHELIRGMEEPTVTADLNPELFPAIIIRMKEDDSTIKVTLFHTGKANITGCRNHDQGWIARQRVFELISLIESK